MSLRKLVLVLLLCPLLAVACTGVSVLEPAHDLAVENQHNLEANLQTIIQEYIRIAQSHPDYDPDIDGPIIEEQARILKEQAAISTAYLVLIDVYIKSKSIDEDTFEKALREIPRIISEGKNVWEELQSIIQEDE